MTRHLSTVPRRAPTARYMTNIGGRSVNSPDAILDDLARAVAHPVRWYDATRVMAELGVTRAVEMLPGHVLTRLWTSSVPQFRCVAVADTGLGAAATPLDADRIATPQPCELRRRRQTGPPRIRQESTKSSGAIFS